MRGNGLWTYFRALLLGAVVCSGSCKKDSPANRYFHAAEDLQTTICKCTEAEDQGVCGRQLNDCERGVVRDFESEIGDFLDCATKRVVEQTRCARKVGCDPELLGACLDNDIEDSCGELPDDTSAAIQRDIELCDDEMLQCDDGSTARGGICDGESDCDDGSDEICEPQTASGGPTVGAAGSFGPVGPMMAPVSMGPTALQACVNSTLTAGGELVSPVCAECACIANPGHTLACDSGCWGFLACVSERCRDPDGGSEAEPTCVDRNCSMLASGATTASSFTTAIRAACTQACPMLF